MTSTRRLSRGRLFVIALLAALPVTAMADCLSDCTTRCSESKDGCVFSAAVAGADCTAAVAMNRSWCYADADSNYYICLGQPCNNGSMCAPVCAPQRDAEKIQCDIAAAAETAGCSSLVAGLTYSRWTVKEGIRLHGVTESAAVANGDYRNASDRRRECTCVYHRVLGLSVPVLRSHEPCTRSPSPEVSGRRSADF